jgi:hypothetical protein
MGMTPTSRAFCRVGRNRIERRRLTPPRARRARETLTLFA